MAAAQRVRYQVTQFESGDLGRAQSMLRFWNLANDLSLTIRILSNPKRVLSRLVILLDTPFYHSNFCSQNGWATWKE